MSLIFRSLHCPITIILPNNDRSAFRIRERPSAHLVCFFFETVPKVFSEHFFIGSWNFLVGGLDSNLYILKVLYALSPFVCACLMSSAMSLGALAPVEMLIRSRLSSKGLTQLARTSSTAETASSSVLVLDWCSSGWSNSLVFR